MGVWAADAPFGTTGCAPLTLRRSSQGLCGAGCCEQTLPQVPQGGTVANEIRLRLLTGENAASRKDFRGQLSGSFTRALLQAVLAALLLVPVCYAGKSAAGTARVEVVIAGEQSCQWTVIGVAFSGDASHALSGGSAFLEIRLNHRFVRAASSPVLPNGWFVIRSHWDYDKCLSNRDPRGGEFRVRFVGAKGSRSGLSPLYRTTCEIIGYDRPCKPRRVGP
jgi:hypothetical protein